MNFQEIFESNKNIAVFGMSTNPSKASQSVPAFFIGKEYNVIPINPRADEIAGQKAYASINDVPDKIDILNVFRPSEETPGIVRMAVKRHKEKGDINLIWLQEGIESDEAKKIAEDAGIDFVQDKCIYQEFMKL